MNLSGFRMFKKAQGINYLAVIIFLFVFGFLSILGYLFTSSFVNEMYDAGYNSTELKYTGDQYLWGLQIFDKIIALIMVILIIGIGVTSYRLSAPPLFFLITFVTGAVYGFVSYFFNYIFSQMISDTIFVATLLYFPITVLICTNLHWVMLVCIAVGSITLYAKKEKGQFLS